LIFFKYLSEKQEIYANKLLEGEDVTEFTQVTDQETLDAISEESIIKLGYYLKPEELFSAVAEK
jgi:type I restriction enzyme M protein